ncbi:MAG TPA: ABC-2 family transporter protein [Planctomycetota bacterium]|nr:ABC-2 family transporter protein [Planctomycetota bacterium]
MLRPSFGLAHKFSLMREFAVSSFHIMLAHRVRYVVGVLNYMTYVAVNYYLWEALYAGVPAGETRAGYTLHDMRTYVSVGWIMRSAYFSNADNILAARINKGEINSDLLRPVSLFLQFYGAALGEAAFRAIFMALPVLLLALCVFDIAPPANALAALGYLYSTFLAFHIFFAINFLTGLIAAWTEKIQGFLWAKFMLLQFLSGLLLPLQFLPYWMQIAFRILPFQGMSYTPMIIYLGRARGMDMALELAFQTAWTIALLFLCSLMWWRVRKRLETLGG